MRRITLFMISLILLANFGSVPRGMDTPRPSQGKKAASTVQSDRRSAAAMTFRLGWPYTAPALPPVPHVKDAAWPKNPMDAFVLARLEAKGLRPSLPATKAQMLRRVYADLVGEPPSPQEAALFLNDSASNAYERLVDRLLSDPRYGERWGRHWLDLVRYADTDGFEYDKLRPHAWRYRDYVVRSFNADKPYDCFLKEQLAGDELFPDNADALIATGFARLSPWDEAAGEDNNPIFIAQRWQDYLNDVTDTTGSVMLGLTVGCARCHNHKYDPISQADYYRMQAFFAPSKRMETALPKDGNDPTSFRQKVAEAEGHLAELKKQMEALREKHRNALREEKRKTAKPDAKVEVSDDELDRRIEKADREKRNQLRDQIQHWEEEATPYRPIAEAVTEEGKNVPVTHLLLRGNLETPGPEVQPGFVASLVGGVEKPADIVPPADGKTTGRRAALANWIASKENPMTARVIVNRLWQYHFGRGLVGTPSDFGKNGEKPTHPELLDWLALRFMEEGWSLKKMHRLMLLSNTYRQSTQHRPAAARVDSENRLLWRMNTLRLEGETLRDSILAVSGQLNPEAGGPGIYPEVGDEVLASSSTHQWGHSSEAQQNRRSIYVSQRRSLILPLLETFDGAVMSNSCPRRAVTTIAPQALMLFNSAFSHAQARYFAQRVLKEVGTDRRKQVEFAYRLALVRPPTEREQQEATAFLTQQTQSYLSGANADTAKAQEAALSALADLCLALLNTNEFLYLD